MLGDDAGRVVNAIFPKYYEFGEIMGFVAFGAAMALEIEGEPLLAVGVLALVGIAANVYASRALVPKMEDAGDDGFARYHRQSVALNAVAMLAVAGALVAAHL